MPKALLPETYQSVQARAARATGSAGGDARALQLKRELAGQPLDVQLARLSPGGAEAVQKAAERGTSGAGGPLPHGKAIQRAFGRHDVSGVKAHTDGAAAEGANAMGAEAFASGDRVAFSRAPSLHTAAHEAAHVVQQRAGVNLKGGVGAEGDAYERHADTVAAQVVQGKSVEALLDQHAGRSSGAAAVATQRIVQRDPKKTGGDQRPSNGEGLKNDVPKNDVPKNDIPKNDVPKTEDVPEKDTPNKLKGEDTKTEKDPKKKDGAPFKSVKILSERNAKVYLVTTQDDQQMVLKYQGKSSTLDDYLLGCAGTSIGLKYPIDQISIHLEGSSGEQRYTEGLKNLGVKVTGSVTAMPLLAFTENEVAMSASTFTNLGKCFAYDIFIYGKDRFAISENVNVNNLFMQGDDPLMIDTPSSHSLYTTRETHKASMRAKLKHEARKTAFNKLYAKAEKTATDNGFNKKIRSEMKQAFHAGIVSGMQEIFANKDEILEHAKRVDEMNEGKHSYVLEHGVDKMLEDLREVLKAKKSLHSEGKVYKFIVD